MDSKEYMRVAEWASLGECEIQLHNGWQRCTNPDIEFGFGAYRRTPDTSIRPWTAEEALGQKVRHKERPDQPCLVTATFRVNGEIVLRAGGFDVKPETLRDQYECLDGSPCGVKE
jgi:hypothetical protein